MPPTRNVVVAMCDVFGARRAVAPESLGGTAMGEGAMAAVGPFIWEISLSTGRRAGAGVLAGGYETACSRCRPLQETRAVFLSLLSLLGLKASAVPAWASRS